MRWTHLTLFRRQKKLRPGRGAVHVSGMSPVPKPAWHSGFVGSERAAKLPPQSPPGFSALARLFYLAPPTKIAMLQMLRRLPFPQSTVLAMEPN